MCPSNENKNYPFSRKFLWAFSLWTKKIKIKREGSRRGRGEGRGMGVGGVLSFNWRGCWEVLKEDKIG